MQPPPEVFQTLLSVYNFDFDVVIFTSITISLNKTENENTIFRRRFVVAVSEDRTLGNFKFNLKVIDYRITLNIMYNGMLLWRVKRSIIDRNSNRYSNVSSSRHHVYSVSVTSVQRNEFDVEKVY